MDVQQDPGEVADQEDHDDGQEDDGQAVLLPPEQADVLRVVAVDVLDVVEAGTPAIIHNEGISSAAISCTLNPTVSGSNQDGLN